MRHERRCAVCGLHLRVGDALVGLVAARIKWHHAGGPGEPANGPALCSLYPRLFGRGAFTLWWRREVEVAEGVSMGEGLRRWLLDFHRAPIQALVSEGYRPGKAFVWWHRREVFRPPSRP